MATANENDPRLHSAGARQSGPHGPEDKIYRLTRRLSETHGSSPSELVEPESKVGPEDRKPEVRSPAEPPHTPAAASSGTPKKSLRRPLMFALLPAALVVGGYFYVTGGAVMSTDNAYVQAHIVGLSIDPGGIG